MNFAELAKAQAAGFFLLSKMAGKISLTTQVQGVLPVVNGGTGSASGTLDHSGLANLSADSHSQYPLLAGRAGGQTLRGGTAGGESLTLQSTAHATKGKLLFGTSAYDEMNNRLGINTGAASLSYPLEVFGDVYIGRDQSTSRTLHIDAGGTGGVRMYSYGTLRASFGMSGTDFNFYAATGNIAFLANDTYMFRTGTIGSGGSRSGAIGIGCNNFGSIQVTPTEVITLDGTQARKIISARHITANTAGNDLTVQAGGATVAATDKSGGQLILMGGASTGTGSSGVTLQGIVAGGSGTSDNSAQDMVKVVGNTLGFFAAIPVVKPVALTSPLTTLTFTAPASPDYAIATVQLVGYGFSTADEGNTVLSVIANLQTRVNGLETKLQALGLLT